MTTMLQGRRRSLSLLRQSEGSSWTVHPVFDWQRAGGIMGATRHGWSGCSCMKTGNSHSWWLVFGWSLQTFQRCQPRWWDVAASAT